MGQSRSYEYEAIGASQPNYRLTAEGGTGDYLRSLIVSITNAVTGTVTIRDGDGPTIPIVPTGTAVGTYVIPIKAVSNTGRWSVTTGAGATVIAVHQATPRIPVAWTIADIFSSGETGVHYDPSDLSTIYQDSAGTTPGAVGSVVGLMLDKSQGLVLGSELVTNGTFDSGITGWTAASSATLSVSGGSLVVTNGGTAFGYAWQAVNTVVGRTYTVEFSVTGGTVTGALFIGTTIGGFENYNSPGRSVGVYVVRFVATATTTYIRLGLTANTVSATFIVDNISVKELPGYHASQSSAGSKPLERQTAGGKYYVDYDGVDDYEVTTTGGGGTTGFFMCTAILPEGGAGANRTILSDAGANIGYAVRLNTSNQLEISAGNGAAFTTIATADTASVGTAYVVTAWDDGTNLNVQINNGTVAQTARPVVSAGTAVITLGKDNGAASGYFNGGMFGMTYIKNGNTVPASQREQTKQYIAARAGVTL